MANVERIISLIDSYLEQNHLVRVSANDASRYLEQEGVLSYSTKGQPLRKILRSGAIPSAIQKEGKGSSWYIYHSGKSSVESSLLLKSMIQHYPTQSILIYPIPLKRVCFLSEANNLRYLFWERFQVKYPYQRENIMQILVIGFGQ